MTFLTHKIAFSQQSETDKCPYLIQKIYDEKIYMQCLKSLQNFGKYWCDYNILINSSPFFVVTLVKKFTIEPFPGSFTFIFHCNISFWASDFVATFSFHFFIPRRSLEHFICACCLLALICRKFVKNLSNLSNLSKLSKICRTNLSCQFFHQPCLFLFFLFFSLSKRIFT